MPFTKPRKILQQGDRSDQPDATTVLEGTLYFVIDEGVIERSNGTIWESWDMTSAFHSIIANQNDWFELFRYILQRIDFIEKALGIEYKVDQDIEVPEELLTLIWR